MCNSFAKSDVRHASKILDIQQGFCTVEKLYTFCNTPKRNAESTEKFKDFASERKKIYKIIVKNNIIAKD